MKFTKLLLAVLMIAGIVLPVHLQSLSKCSPGRPLPGNLNLIIPPLRLPMRMQKIKILM